MYTTTLYFFILLKFSIGSLGPGFEQVALVSNEKFHPKFLKKMAGFLLCMCTMAIERIKACYNSSFDLLRLSVSSTVWTRHLSF